MCIGSRNRRRSKLGLITRSAMPESVTRELASVSTVLTPNERIRVDAAGEGSYRTLHRESVEDVIHDLKLNRAQAVLFSVARCDQRSRTVVARVVREFPRVPTFALLTEVDRGSPHRSEERRVGKECRSRCAP